VRWNKTETQSESVFGVNKVLSLTDVLQLGIGVSTFNCMQLHLV